MTVGRAATGSGPGPEAAGGTACVPGAAIRAAGSLGPWGATPADEIARRVEKVQENLERAGIDLAIIVQNADLYYLTGTIQQGQLLLPAHGEPLFLVRKDLARAREESPLANIAGIASFKELPAAVARLGVAPTAVLGMELDVMPVNVFQRYEPLFAQATIRDCSMAIRDSRSVKSEHELGIMADAAVIADLAVKTASEVLREGMTEVELSARCETTMRLAGHQGLVRFRSFNQEWAYSHIYAGPSAAVPSFGDTPLGGPGVSAAVAQGSGWRPIGRGEPVVVDLVCCAGGYCVDQTRILCLGPLPADLREAYGVCVEAQDILKQTSRTGVACGEIYQRVVDRVAELGYADKFMGAPRNQMPYIAHGLGLEIDEPPYITLGSAAQLQTDQTFACEPKLVFPGRGVVGIENTWRVTPLGLTSITISKEGIIEL